MDSLSIILVNSSLLSNRDPIHARRILEIKEIINVLGVESANAQNLPRPITSASKIAENSDQRLYYAFDRNSNSPIGFIKVGKRQLFLIPPNNVSFRPAHKCPSYLYSGPAYSQLPTQSNGRNSNMYSSNYLESDPMCVLDFYVRQDFRRIGVGKVLFEVVIREEGIPHPSLLAFDRPSLSLRNFLSRHYHLSSFQSQTCNMVVFDEFYRQITKLWDKGYHIQLDTNKSSHFNRSSCKQRSSTTNTGLFNDLLPISKVSSERSTCNTRIQSNLGTNSQQLSVGSPNFLATSHEQENKNYQILRPKFHPSRGDFSNPQRQVGKAENSIFFDSSTKPLVSFPHSLHDVTASTFRSQQFPSTSVNPFAINLNEKESRQRNVQNSSFYSRDTLPSHPNLPSKVDFSYSAQAIGCFVSSPKTSTPLNEYHPDRKNPSSYVHPGANPIHETRVSLPQEDVNLPSSTSYIRTSLGNAYGKTTSRSKSKENFGPFPSIRDFPSHSSSSSISPPSRTTDSFSWDPQSDLSFREQRMRMVMTHGRRNDNLFLS